MDRLHIKFTSATADYATLDYSGGDISSAESKKTLVERLASLKSRSYGPQSRSVNVIPYNRTPAEIRRLPLRETAFYYDGGRWYRDYDCITEYNRSGIVTHEKQTAYYPDMSIKAAIDASYEPDENGHPVTETYSVSDDGVTWRKWGLIKNLYDKKRANAVLHRQTYGWNEISGSWQYIRSSYLNHLTQIFYDDSGRVSVNVLWYGSERDGTATDRITYRYGSSGVLESIIWEFLTPNDIAVMEATDIRWHHTDGNYITFGNDIYDIFDDDIRNNAPLSYTVTEYDGSGTAISRKGRVTYDYDDTGRLILKRAVTGSQRRIFTDILQYDLDENGSYSEEHYYGTDNNGSGVLELNEAEGYSRTERIFDENGNIVLKNEYVLDDDMLFLDFSSCRTCSDVTTRLDLSTRHTYRYGSRKEILSEKTEVRPYGSSTYIPKSEHVYSDFTDIAEPVATGGADKRSTMVTYRNGSLFFDGTEGTSFTVVDMRDRICMKGRTTHEISVINLSSGLYRVIINGQSVRFFKR